MSVFLVDHTLVYVMLTCVENYIFMNSVIIVVMSDLSVNKFLL